MTSETSADGFVLRVLRGEQRGVRVVWSADETLLIGRDPEAGLVLTDEHISARHGQITPREGALVYQDLGSTNGSILLRAGERRVIENGREVALQNADRLLVGDPDFLLLIAVYTSLDNEAHAEASQVLAVTHIGQIHTFEGRVSSKPDILRLLYDGLKRLSRTELDLTMVLESGVDMLFESLPSATHITLMLESEASEEKRFIPVLCQRRGGAHETPQRPSRWLRAKILEEGTAILSADTATELGSKSLRSSDIDSMIAAPLFAGERIIGIVQVDHRSTADVPGRPFNQDELELVVVVASQFGLAIQNARLYQRVLRAEQQLTDENRFLKQRDAEPALKMVGESDAMQQVRTLIGKVCDTAVPVCIVGETGTGKELVARAIHYQSRRSDKLFVAQNCAALPENLLESELFGHKKGAFTGAESDKKGLFELAHGGTIFLDEIGETSPTLQAKLLRVLQEGEIRPVGATHVQRVDVRILSATNRNLEEEVVAGRFREDLYYRLNVFPIHLPPLRDRQSDIPLLTEFFMRRFAFELDRTPLLFSPTALDLMKSYKWPGNIRELQNEIQRVLICVTEGEFVMPPDLSPRIRSIERLLSQVQDNPDKPLKQRVNEVERYMLIEALRAHNNNKTRTAESLGITREGLHKKLARFGIS